MVSLLRKPIETDAGNVVHRSDEGIVHLNGGRDSQRKQKNAIRYFSGGGNRMNAPILDSGEIEDLQKVYRNVKDVLK
jgi:hypothetical protein